MASNGLGDPSTSTNSWPLSQPAEASSTVVPTLACDTELGPTDSDSASIQFPPAPSSPLEIRRLRALIPRLFAQIHYFPALEEYNRCLVFPCRPSLSALDLATDPLSFSIASKYNDRLIPYSQLKLQPNVLISFFSYPPRRQLPQGYTRDPANRFIRHFPLFSEAVSAYEERSMLPVTLWERRTTPILFSRRPKVLKSYLGRLTFTGDDLEDRSKFHQRLDALDIQDRAMVKVTFHPDCQTKSCTPIHCTKARIQFMKWNQCSRVLVWDGQLYRRRKVIPLSSFSLWRRSTHRLYRKTRRRFRRRVGRNPALWVAAIAIGTVAAAIGLIWSAGSVGFSIAWTLNSISGGGILGAIFARFKLDSVMGPLDRRVCPHVTRGDLPCVIPSNPDVAGIGGRLALYIQTVCLITLLALKPKGASTSRLTLAVTSLAFGFSALISALTHQLTLYHIILAAKFQTLPLLTASIVEFQAPPDRPWYMYYINRLRWVVNAGVILWYTFTAPCFGLPAQCNVYIRSQSYFTTGFATKAAPRITSLINAFSTCIALGVDAMLTFERYEEKKRYPRSLPRDVRRLRDIQNVLQLYAANWLFDNTSPLLHISTKQKTVGKRSIALPLPVTSRSGKMSMIRQFIVRMRYWLNLMYRAFIFALPYPKFIRYLISLIVTIILIANVENTLNLNTIAPGDNAWTYGQVLAVFLTVVPVMQVWILFGLWLPAGLLEQKKQKSD